MGNRRPTARGGSARILVVDDEEDIRETLDMVLCREGYTVVTAPSGGRAVELAAAEPFDLVITDLRMPGLSGADTITAVKSLQPEARVMVASGYASEDVTADCFRRGAADCIRKPFDLDELLDRVKALLG